MRRWRRLFIIAALVWSMDASADKCDDVDRIDYKAWAERRAARLLSDGIIAPETARCMSRDFGVTAALTRANHICTLGGDFPDGMSLEVYAAARCINYRTGEHTGEVMDALIAKIEEHIMDEIFRAEGLED